MTEFATQLLTFLLLHAATINKCKILSQTCAFQGK